MKLKIEIDYGKLKGYTRSGLFEELHRILQEVADLPLNPEAAGRRAILDVNSIVVGKMTQG